MTIPPIESIGSLGPSGLEASAQAKTGGQGTFAEALKGALNQVEATQNRAEGAAVEVATGTTNDPQQAIVQVQNGLLEMELAAQLRNKATEAIQSLLQTQV